MRTGNRGDYAAIVALAAIAACAEDTTDFEAPPLIRAEREWTIDGHEADLTPVTWLAVSAAGDITYVSQELDRRVLAYANGGELRGQFGRTGDGPGEFRSMTRGGTLGDTVWVYDPAQRRLTFVDSGLDLIRTVSWPTGSIALNDGQGSLRANVEGVAPNGFMYANLQGMPGSPDFEIMRVALVDLDGQVRRLLVDEPMGPSFVTIAAEAGILGVHYPFPVLPTFAVSANGAFSALVTVAVEGENAGTFQVTSFDHTGEATFTRRYPFARTPISAAQADSAIQEGAARLSERFPDGVGQYRRSVWVPPLLPPVERLVVGRDGSVWIGIRSDDAATSTYYVIAPSGELVGEVLFPDRVLVRVADRNTAWGTITDEVGVRSVVKYRLDG